MNIKIYALIIASVMMLGGCSSASVKSWTENCVKDILDPSNRGSSCGR